MLKKIILFTLLLIVLIILVFTQFLKRGKLVFEGQDLSPYVEQEYRDEVDQTLENAGENRGELIEFLTEVDPAYKKGASFLKCQSCGNVSTESGEVWTGAQDRSGRNCPNCGKPLEREYKYCPFCGKQL